jgi:hypothetical protein
MYDYRILFPRLGRRQIRRELGLDPRIGPDRRRPDGAYWPASRTRQGRP